MFNEQTLSPEKEKEVETKIILEFMRYGEKESDKNKDNKKSLEIDKNVLEDIIEERKIFEEKAEQVAG